MDEFGQDNQIGNAIRNISVPSTLNITFINETTAQGCFSDPMCYTMRSVEWLICLVLSLVGILGNTLSIKVLQGQRQRTSNVFLLQCLCSADSLLLSAALCMSCIYVWELAYLRPTNQTMKGVIVIAFDLFQFTSNWILVQLTVDRYIAVCRPFLAARWCTLRRAWRCVFVVSVGSVALTLPRAITFFLHQNYNTLMLAYSLISTIFRYVLPIMILAVLNTKLICEIRESRKKELQLSRVPDERPMDSLIGVKQSSRTNKKQRSDNVTINLIAVIVIFLVCGTCRGIYFVLATGFAHVYRACYGCLVYNVVTNILMIFNSAVNFLVYCLFYRKFRTTAKIVLRDIFIGTRRSRDQERMQYTDNTVVYLNDVKCQR